ncbi:MAG: type II toxin-antitoxin system RelB/DinJ family antitoxin [Clostridia bacterium]|nr:type II toxin-antitoxin system RelB/DinJ family antitoxin [Clostridia bacterium]
MKDATVSARVELGVKTEAEDILQLLGIPVSVVINSLYRQIIYRRGVPFAMTLPAEPRTLDAMTDAELNTKLPGGSDGHGHRPEDRGDLLRGRPRRRYHRVERAHGRL